MKFKFLFLLLILNISTFNNFAQIGDDLSKFINMGGKIISAPIHFDSRDILNLTLVTAATAGSFFLDNTGRQWALHNRSSFSDNLFNADKNSNLIIAAGVIGIYGYGFVYKNNKIRTLGLQLAEATFYASGVNFLFKSLFGRTRPSVNKGHKDFDPIKFSFNQTSLPSGHSTLAFAFSTVMAYQIDNIFWKVGWYSAASLVSIGRVYRDKHWVSDVVLGSAIGYFVGRFVLNNQTDDDNGLTGTNKNKPTYSLGLKYYNNQPIYSLNFVYSF
jgi:membrane-associated phospholipid phosphatase